MITRREEKRREEKWLDMSVLYRFRRNFVLFPLRCRFGKILLKWFTSILLPKDLERVINVKYVSGGMPIITLLYLILYYLILYYIIFFRTQFFSSSKISWTISVKRLESGEPFSTKAITLLMNSLAVVFYIWIRRKR